MATPDRRADGESKGVLIEQVARSFHARVTGTTTAEHAPGIQRRLMQHETRQLPRLKQRILENGQLHPLPVVTISRTRLQDRQQSNQRQPVPRRKAAPSQRELRLALQVTRQRLYSSQFIPRAAGERGAVAEARSCCLTDSMPAARASGGR